MRRLKRKTLVYGWPKLNEGCMNCGRGGLKKFQPKKPFGERDRPFHEMATFHEDADAEMIEAARFY